MRFNLRFVPALFATALFAMPMAQAQTATLDGRVFIADAGVKGKAAGEKNDVITFSGGKFHSSSCDQYGFGKGDYRASASGDAVAFEAETQRRTAVSCGAEPCAATRSRARSSTIASRASSLPTRRPSSIGSRAG